MAPVLAGRMRLARERALLTQRELGDAIGVSPQHISKWERGVVDPSVANLRKIAKALNVDVGHLLD